MKKISGLVAILLIAAFSYALTPPTAVKKVFETKFPKATSVSWTKEKPMEWESTFTQNGERFSATFAMDGAWLETEERIKSSDLPRAISDAIKSKYEGWEIVEADRTETVKNGSVYEADLKKGMMKKEVVYKADGTFVRE